MIYNFGKTCFEYCHKLGIGSFTEEKVFKLTIKELKTLKSNGSIFTAFEGGLVLGNSHHDGGIHLLSPLSNEKFRYVGEMEGWEYLTPALTDLKAIAKYQELNSYHIEEEHYVDTLFKVPKGCKVINLKEIQVPFILITHGTHVVINRSATKKYINEIISLDDSAV